MNNSWRARALSFVLAAAAAPLSAAPFFDQLILQDADSIARLPLPAGPVSAWSPVPAGITSLLALPSGRLLATTVQALHPVLNELLPNGTLRPIKAIPGPEGETAADMALDHRGRLFVVVVGSASGFSPRLVELDPVSGDFLGERLGFYPGHGIATAPDGLWGLQGHTLWKIDPDAGRKTAFLDFIVPGTTANDIESDSAGRVWYVSRTHTFPLVQKIAWVDPSTGETGSTLELPADSPEIHNIALARLCSESATVRCLQTGRFRAEVSFRAYDGAAGAAAAAPARSRDTAVFSFFESANWELMIKALDGCHLNGHFWVYAAASTDVEYAMAITDMKTGARKVYANPLGQVAETVTDNLAFPCSP